jgi:hypothetical protein
VGGRIDLQLMRFVLKGREMASVLAFWDEWDTKKDVILKNEPERLLKTKDRPQKRTENEPENEAEKLLKIGSCGKNEPETNPRTNRAMLLKTLET